MTPISVSGTDGYLLGPLATDPAHRGRGAGKLLVKEVSALALARGEGSFVLLVGDEPYYGPLGFAPTTPGAIQFPGPVDPKRVLLHSADPTLALRLSGPIAAFGARKRV
jgi:predicted N-acetyltransferase YhbS